MKEKEKKFQGVCTFYSETGTEGGYWAFQEEREEGYDGLHILKNGDRLTIYSQEKLNEIIWSGVISLKRHPLFTEDAFGMWIHADQIGVDRIIWANWFFEEYPAELIVGRKKKGGELHD